MNKVQKNAIREADNYLKYAGLPSFSSLFFGQPAGQATPEPSDDFDAGWESDGPNTSSPYDAAQAKEETK